MWEITAEIMAGIMVVLMILLVVGLIGWMFIDMCCPNLFRGIRIKFTVKGCVDFIKAVYNMETR